MNFVAFSPHFPSNYRPFWTNLRRMGVNVLGLADAAYDELHPELKNSLNEYYRLSNAHNYDELVRAVGYYTYHYGKIDRLESHNEYWLESDARLRTDFNIKGFQTSDVARIKRKSEMKKQYLKAAIPVARGRVVGSLQEACTLVDEVGYPLIAKPDIGVGAARTYKIEGPGDLERFFADKPPVDYIFEEFIQGTIETFDGLTDQDGNVVFYSSMVYSDGVMEIVNQGLDFCYTILREIPADLVKMGKKLVKVYGLRERFFHFEFFRTPQGQLIGLEVNMRPPGGLTTDMFNYANDIDVYREYANIVTRNCFDARVTRPYYCAYVGRKYANRYLHDYAEAVAAFPGKVVHQEKISGVFSAAIGDYGYLVRSSDREEVRQIIAWILQKQ
jgi:biotin carboxylase